jgi:hypothetical protein
MLGEMDNVGVFSQREGLFQSGFKHLSKVEIMDDD